MAAKAIKHMSRYKYDLKLSCSYLHKKERDKFSIKTLVLVVGDSGTDAIYKKKNGLRESNLEGIYNKTVRVFFLPNFSTLQFGGSISM